MADDAMIFWTSALGRPTLSAQDLPAIPLPSSDEAAVLAVLYRRPLFPRRSPSLYEVYEFARCEFRPSSLQRRSALD